MILALALAGCGLAPEPGATPEERLDALAPGLAAAVAAQTDDLGSVADVLEQAEPALVPMLLPRSAGPLTDDLAEIDGPDIAQVAVTRTVAGGSTRLKGRVTGVDLAAVQLLIDTRGGPAPDLRIDLGQPVMQGELVPGTPQVASSAAMPGTAVKDDHGWSFDLTLPGAGPVGMTVRAPAPGTTEGGRGTVDEAPGGVYGAPGDAVALLVALLEDPHPDAARDPDLLLAVSLAWAPWLRLVEPAVAPTVRADALARLRYADEVDAWLGQHGASWRVHALGGVQKITWAWPGAESAVYGARPLAWEPERLSAEAYRFHVADVDTLRALRAGLPVAASPAATADQRDARIWADLAYRADDAGMQALCDQKLLDRRTCFRWQQDRTEGRSLGTVDGAPVPLNLGTSASMQVDRWLDEDSFAGDCATATTVALAAFQAVGLAPLAIGWAGDSWYQPTHNMPLVWNGRRYAPVQDGPSAKWNDEAAFVYAPLPVLNPSALGVGWGGAGARGPAVAGTQTTYGELNEWLADGIPAEWVLRWLDEGRQGEWPEIR